MGPIVKELKGAKGAPACATPCAFLVASPQCVTDKSLPWHSLILELSAAKLIQQVVVDEFHSWWKQGLSFRAKFNKVGSKIIAETRKKSPSTSVALLTATSKLIDIALAEPVCGARAS